MLGVFLDGIGVIATGPISVHQTQLLPEWGSVTFLLNGAIELDDDARRDLSDLRVSIAGLFTAARVHGRRRRMYPSIPGELGGWHLATPMPGSE